MAGTYEYIVNRSRDFITLINRDYHYEIVNDAYCEAVALTRNELVGMHASDVWGAQRFEETIKPKLDECFSGTIFASVRCGKAFIARSTPITKRPARARRHPTA
jgi:PAS domain-containing protein